MNNETNKLQQMYTPETYVTYTTEEVFLKYQKFGIISPISDISESSYSIDGLWKYDKNLGVCYPTFNFEERNYLIYFHILPTSLYIGQTNQFPVEKRWMRGEGYKKNKLFYLNIKKYGWENIGHVVFKDGLTKKEANIMEKELIHYFVKKERETGKTVLNLNFNEI